MGRRWGKTVLGGTLSMATANAGGNVAWIVPIYKNGRTLWRWAENITGPARKAGLVKSSKTERIMEFPSGGQFGIYSADNEDSIRGEAFNLVVLDEAARISETAWTDAIMPTLADADGDAILISTPRGLNWFHSEWARGKDDMHAQASWTAPSAANPSPQIQQAARLAKARVPDRTYKQEWLAEFISDGAYFQGIDQAAIIQEPDQPDQHQGHYLMMGIDWALSEDFTVLTLACRECNRVVAWERFNQIDYSYQRMRVIDMARRWEVAGLLPERNSIGVPNIELLIQADLPIVQGPDSNLGFNTTATTKPQLIQALASALEHDNFLVPVDYADELRSYRVELSTSGHAKFNAPEGSHDDRVISLALAWWALSNGQWLMS